MKERGADGASVEAVMREAGLTVGGFYAHFASKDELMREALLFGIEASFARLVHGLDALEGRPFLRALIGRYRAATWRWPCSPHLPARWQWRERHTRRVRRPASRQPRRHCWSASWGCPARPRYRRAR